MPTTTTTWADPRGTVWNVTFSENEDGDLTSVTVTSATGKDDLPLTTLTRDIPFGTLLERIRQQRYLKSIPDGTTWQDSTGRSWAASGTGLQLGGDVPKKRRKINRQLMEEVAEVYKAASGLRNPTEKVKEHFFVSQSTAARWVSTARREPFNTLPPTTKGKST